MIPAGWVGSRSTIEVIHGSLRAQPVSLKNHRTLRALVSSMPIIVVGAACPSDLAERQSGILAHVLVLVVEGGDERSHGMSADIAKRRNYSLAHSPVVVLDDGDEGVDGAGVTELAECGGGSPANAVVIVFEGADEGVDGTWVAELAECGGGSPPVCADLFASRVP